MKQQTHYFKIGLFVILALALLIAGLIAFGAEFWSTNVILMETYLDESVQGLSVGSAVLQRGVNIGRVKQITFVARAYPDIVKPGTPEYEKFGSYVMVIMEIDQKHFPSYRQDPEVFKQRLRDQISNGLRVKLSYQGITGLCFLEMDYVNPEKPPLFPPWMPNHIYVPSTPSLITSFTSAVENIFHRLENIPIEQAVNQLTETLNRIQVAIDEAEISRLRQSAVTLMEDIRHTSKQLRTAVVQISDPNRLGDIPAAAEQVRRMSARIERLIDTHEYDIDVILMNLKNLSRNLRDLSENLKQDPAQLLFSSPPAKSETVQ